MRCPTCKKCVTCRGTGRVRTRKKGSPIEGRKLKAAVQAAFFDKETLAWIEVRRERHKDDQLQFVDMLTPVFRVLMERLSVSMQRIVITVAASFSVGLTVAEIAYASRMEPRAVSSYLTRAVRAKLLRRTRQPRPRYIVPNKDFLRLYALRWNQNRGLDWRHWRDLNPMAPAGQAVDLYIEYLEKC